MIFINHRINTIQNLSQVPAENGVEIDIRYHENNLVLEHDPFSHHEKEPTLFEDFLKVWKHQGPMILNIKTEGVEEKCIELMNRYSVNHWFFLDLSMPCFVKYAKKAARGIKGFSPENLAVRFSEEEVIEYALNFKDRVRWVWIDCFTKFPLDKNNYDSLKKNNFKLCLVSPELQGHDLSKINEFATELKSLSFDAICTKRPDLWKQEGIE